MNFSERLKGSVLENDRDAKAICGILDWLVKASVDRSPSHRDFASMLGLGESGSSRARKTLMSLEREGIIERSSGTGRKSDKLKIPKNGNTQADKKAAFEKRRNEWKLLVQKELAIYVKNDDWSLVKEFYEYWSEDTGEFLMVWEKEAEELKKKGRRFTIRKRFLTFCEYKKKKDASPTLFASSAERVSDEEYIKMEQKKKKKMGAAHNSGIGYIEAQRKFLAEGGTMEQWREMMKNTNNKK